MQATAPASQPHSRPVLAALARLPLAWWRASGWLVGRVLAVAAVPRRRVVDRNLALCFPERSAAWRRRVARGVFVRFAQSWLDRIWLWHGEPDMLRQRLQLEGDVSALSQPFEAQVLFAPHFMGLDAGWTALSLLTSQPLVTLYARGASPWQDRWIAQGRSRFAPAGLLPRVGSAKAVIKALRDQSALYLLPDMDLGERDAVFVPFMGVSAATVTALPRFAHLGRCGVRAVRTHMTPTGYRTCVSPTWAGFPSGDDTHDVATMNQQLAAWVRERPEEYYWVHRRFKTRPAGEPGVYQR
jgi:Kdo2-lipid IVA lauroyltransferase/acyltransferase